MAVETRRPAPGEGDIDHRSDVVQQVIRKHAILQPERVQSLRLQGFLPHHGAVPLDTHPLYPRFFIDSGQAAHAVPRVWQQASRECAGDGGTATWGGMAPPSRSPSPCASIERRAGSTRGDKDGTYRHGYVNVITETPSQC